MITMKNFIGNVDFIRLLRISLAAAKAKNEALPHLLLKGPAGTGKTTLAEAIAEEFDTKPRALTSNTAKKSEELRKLFLKMPGEGYDQDGNIIARIAPQIIFVDEIHQLPLLAQENLGLAMQDWRLPVNVNGEDTFEWVPRFCLIGATTLPGKLSKPFLDRFKIQADFETYSRDESIKIAHLHAENKGITLAEGVASAVAQRSRGVARLIVRFLDRVHDAAIVTAHQDNRPQDGNHVSLRLAKTMLKEFLKVDDRGLTKTDIKILTQLCRITDPVGLETLAAIANEDKMTIQNTVEPYLIQEGLLLRTKRGRIITDEGRRYLHAEGYIHEGPGAMRGRVIGALKK